MYIQLVTFKHPQEIMTYCMTINPDIRAMTYHPRLEEYHVIVAVEDPTDLEKYDIRNPWFN